MTYGSGISAQLGIATESSFNTYAAVSRFYEFTSESTNYEKNVQVGMGLRGGGALPRSQRRVVTTFGASGDITLDLPTRGLGLLLSHAMGSTPSPTTVASGVFSYSFTLGSPNARSFSAQVGVPQFGGTITPKTLTGCKVTSFSLGVENGGIATGSFSLDAAGFTTSQALATATYSANTGIFHFAQGAVSVDGSPVANIRDFTVTVDNVLKTDRYNLGSSGAKAAQVVNGFRAITGTMTAEFTDTTLLTKFLSDANTGLSLSFVGDTITGVHRDTLTITLPAVKFDGNAPQVGGPEVVEVSMSFTAYDNGTDQPMTVLYQTADAAL